jgi:hypothetical protein
MKKLFILSAIAFSGLIYSKADAQIGIHVGFHFHLPRLVIPAPPVVVERTADEQPAPVYQEQPADYQEQPVAYQDQAPAYNDNADDYYYLPDVDAYYDVNNQCYFYFDGDNWISAAYLPGEYRSYDWRSARRFEVRAARPYMHDDFYRSRFNGHQVAGFAHNNYRSGYNNGYANRGFSNNAPRFNDRGPQRQAQPMQFNQGFSNNAARFNSRGPERQAQPVQYNRGDFNRQAAPQQNRDNGQRFNNHSQDTRGGNEHFARMNQPAFNDHRMSKF